MKKHSKIREALKSLALLSVMILSGCGLGYHDECLPDTIQHKSSGSIVTKFNGKAVDADITVYTEINPSRFTLEDDQVVEVMESSYRILHAADTTIQSLPTAQGQSKTIDLSINLPLDYYTVTEVGSGESVSLPLLEKPDHFWGTHYFGWNDDETISFKKYFSSTSSGLLRISITKNPVLNYSMKFSMLDAKVTGSPIQAFPDVSPNGTYSTHKVSESRAWVGSVKVTVQKNEPKIYELKYETRLTHGDDVFEQERTQAFETYNAFCKSVRDED